MDPLHIIAATLARMPPGAHALPDIADRMSDRDEEILGSKPNRAKKIKKALINHGVSLKEHTNGVEQAQTLTDYGTLEIIIKPHSGMYVRLDRPEGADR